MLLAINANGVTGIIDDALERRANVNAVPKLAAQPTANKSPQTDVATSCADPKAMNAIPHNAKQIVQTMRREMCSPIKNQLEIAENTGIVAMMKTVLETAVKFTDIANIGPLIARKKPYHIALVPMLRNTFKTFER